MAKHRYPMRPIDYALVILSKIIVRLTGLHAILLMKQGRKAK